MSISRKEDRNEREREEEERAARRKGDPRAGVEEHVRILRRDEGGSACDRARAHPGGELRDDGRLGQRARDRTGAGGPGVKKILFEKMKNIISFVEIK